MSWDNFWDDFRRRRRSRFPFFDRWPFDDIEMMRNMERMMEEAFKEYEDKFPKEMVRERRLPNGRIVKEYGPVVYGYSITLDPEGKPIIREFGNVKPSLQPSLRGVRPSLDIKTEREPLIDIMSDNGNIRVTAEIPGVEKEKIKLTSTSNTLTISVDAKERKYFKELDLPEEVDPKSARSVYKNGVLEVVLAKVKEKKPKGEPIKIE